MRPNWVRVVNVCENWGANLLKSLSQRDVCAADRSRASSRRAIALIGVAGALFMSGSAQAQVKSWFEFKNPVSTIQEPQAITGPANVQAPVFSPNAPVVAAFEGISQYQTASLGRSFIPPDTMGAVGTTQFATILNGAFAVYDKTSGAQLSLTTDNAFWQAAGGVATGGDPRLMFNANANRWVAVGFGESSNSTIKNLQIAVSNTDDALGGWKSTSFEAYSGAGLFRPIADYPTLAMDTNALYIGTNNFAGGTAGAAQTWRGTTLNVIPLADIMSASGPSASNVTQFQSYNNTPGQTNSYNGFAIQGVNSNEITSTGNIVTVSATDYGIQRYDITNAGTASAARTAAVDIALNSYTGLCGGTNCAARQPGEAGTGSAATGLRNIDALDDRISSSAYEVNGRIYTLHTIMEAGSDFTQVRYYVLDSVTNAILDQGNIGGGGFDYYQGSLAVNADGKVVIAYNRSGGIAKGQDGRISIMARTFSTDANGNLVQEGDEILIKQSLTGGYLNGNTEASGSPAGRQRWGDYSQVTLDPTNSDKFWVIGEFAREANTLANHPDGTGSGFSRWGTFISAVSWNNNAGVAVPEPQSWALMILGLGAVGYAMRRRRQLALA